MKVACCVILIVFVIAGLFVWWFDIGSWRELQVELLYEYPSGRIYRTDDNKKFDADMYSWYSMFSYDDFVAPDDKEILAQYEMIETCNFDQYTYILSYGFTIKELYTKNSVDESRMGYGKVVHGIDCNPDTILLYRIPKTYIEPNPDRRDSFSYRFVE